MERFAFYGRAFILVGLSLVPVTFYRGAAGPFSTPKITVLWFAALGAVASWKTWSFARGIRLPGFRIGYATATFVGAAGLATVYSLSPTLSLTGVYQRHGGLIPLLVYVAIMFAVVGLYWQGPERLRAIAWAIGVGSLAVAGSVLLQKAGIDRVLWEGPVPGTLFDYPPGATGQSNFAGAHLGMALPCLWYLALTVRRPIMRAALARPFQ